MTKERELLRRALIDALRENGDPVSIDAAEFLEEMTYLSTPSDDTEEPVAWLHPSGGVIQKAETRLEEDTYTIPLYLHPPRPEPAIKLMTDQEILKGIDADICPYETVLAFVSGVRFAERHHGIGGEA